MKTYPIAIRGNVLDFDEVKLEFTSGWDNPIRYYDDDANGILFVARNTYGIVAFIRARSFERAYDIFLDEFAYRVAPEDIHEAYGFDTKEELNVAVANAESGDEYPDLIEGYSHMPNSGGTTGIVSHDLNGESLDEVTVELLEHLEVKLTLVFGKE